MGVVKKVDFTKDKYFLDPEFFEKFSIIDNGNSILVGRDLGRPKTNQRRVLLLHDVIGVLIQDFQEEELEILPVTGADYYRQFSREIEEINESLRYKVSLQGIKNFPKIGETTISRYNTLDSTITWEIRHHSSKILATQIFETPLEERPFRITTIKYKPASSYSPNERHYYEADEYSNF